MISPVGTRNGASAGCLEGFECNQTPADSLQIHG